MKNTFYGVGVGPGDPKLLTLKALEILKHVPVLAVPRTKGKNTLALDIVRGALDVEEKELVFLDFPMVRKEDRRAKAVKDNLVLLLTLLRSGRDVAMLSLGDASTFSNLSYFLEPVAQEGFSTEIIPGVPSYCAGAALLGISLTHRDLPLHILPAGVEGFEEFLHLPGSKILMKPTLALAELKDRLRKADVLEHVQYVEKVTLPGERSGYMIEREDECSYFTTLFVPAMVEDDNEHA